MKLRIAGVPEPYNLPWHLAMEKGAFAEAGIELDWHTVPEGTGRMCQLLRDRDLDMAVLVTEGAVRDILNGGPHRIVSTFVESPLPWGVHVPARSELREGSDLRGVRYLEVVHSMEGAAERMAHDPSVIFLWETYVTSRYVDAGIMRHVDTVRGDWPGFVIVAHERFIGEQAPAMDRALAVLRDEARVLKDDPHAVALVMRNANFKKALAKEWLKHVRWKVERPEEKDLKTLVATLKTLDLVAQEAPIEVLRR